MDSDNACSKCVINTECKNDVTKIVDDKDKPTEQTEIIKSPELTKVLIYETNYLECTCIVCDKEVKIYKIAEGKYSYETSYYVNGPDYGTEVYKFDFFAAGDDHESLVKGIKIAKKYTLQDELNSF